MKFGQVTDPTLIDFSFPQDHQKTEKILKQNKNNQDFSIYVGCAKWNKTDLKGFYPKGIKDELGYYSTQFNAIEMNSTFYGMPSPQQILIWKDKTPSNFKFFPKITNTISHYRRLIDVTDIVTQYISSILYFGEKLGMVFLQLHDNFAPKDISRLEKFVKDWPEEIPLAVELRNANWFSEEAIFNEICQLFEQKNITNIIVDTAGRRDMLHMRLTTPTAFVRYVGSNSDSDFSRLDDWLERIKLWKEYGLQNLYFFVHQNIEEASPLLSAYFIEKLNQILSTNLHIPVLATDKLKIGSLFD